MMQMFMMEKYIQLKYFALKAKRKVVTKSKKLTLLFLKEIFRKFFLRKSLTTNLLFYFFILIFDML